MTFTPLPGQRVEGYDLTERLDTDFYAVFRDVPDADRSAWDRAKTFADEVIPVIDDYWDRGEYNLDFARRMGELDLFTDGVEHDGITHLSPLAAGLVNMEISRGDGSMGTILAVQGGLALRTLALFGSDQQKAQYLEPVARGRVLASFALTEPDHGSDSVSLETQAVKDGDEWVL
jgi:glutaryl-CoA dehydrogenase